MSVLVSMAVADAIPSRRVQKCSTEMLNKSNEKQPRKKGHDTESPFTVFSDATCGNIQCREPTTKTIISEKHKSKSQKDNCNSIT